tara:strand:- start:516 stop:755 length:240 start_codon:yes stop_codon:yes gene_type:complete
MVWFRLITFIISFQVFANELTEEEIFYFNFLDLNNDKFISKKETDQTINLVFQLIDKNQDDKISLNEIKELKKIVTNFK